MLFQLRLRQEGCRGDIAGFETQLSPRLRSGSISGDFAKFRSACPLKKSETSRGWNCELGRLPGLPNHIRSWNGPTLRPEVASFRDLKPGRTCRSRDDCVAALGASASVAELSRIGWGHRFLHGTSSTAAAFFYQANAICCVHLTGPSLSGHGLK